MRSVVFTPEAEEQLIALHFYLASAASSEIAERYIDAILEQCESLQTFPVRGTGRDDIRPGLRTIGFRRRVTIAFSITDRTVVIHSIFYGGQDVETALAGE
jgi:toxin ParE1/3/4